MRTVVSLSRRLRSELRTVPLIVIALPNAVAAGIVASRTATGNSSGAVLQLCIAIVAGTLLGAWVLARRAGAGMVSSSALAVIAMTISGWILSIVILTPLSNSIWGAAIIVVLLIGSSFGTTAFIRRHMRRGGIVQRLLSVFRRRR